MATSSAEQRVTDERLNELEGMSDRLDRITVPRLPPSATVAQMADQAAIIDVCNALRPLIAEVRALRAREAELLAERGDWQAMARIEVLDRLGQLRNQRDELRQRIGNALVWCRKANPLPHLNGDQLAGLRAALTGTENTDHG